MHERVQEVAIMPEPHTNVNIPPLHRHYPDSPGRWAPTATGAV